MRPRNPDHVWSDTDRGRKRCLKYSCYAHCQPSTHQYRYEPLMFIMNVAVNRNCLSFMIFEPWALCILFISYSMCKSIIHNNIVNQHHSLSLHCLCGMQGLNGCVWILTLISSSHGLIAHYGL